MQSSLSPGFSHKTRLYAARVLIIRRCTDTSMCCNNQTRLEGVTSVCVTGCAAGTPGLTNDLPKTAKIHTITAYKKAPRIAQRAIAGLKSGRIGRSPKGRTTSQKTHATANNLRLRTIRRLRLRYRLRLRQTERRRLRHRARNAACQGRCVRPGGCVRG